jgi:hypothetical protein
MNRPDSMPASHWPGAPAQAAMQAGISSVCHCVWPALSDQRCSARPGMSTQYKAWSSARQTGLSPVPLRASTMSSARLMA